MLEKIKRWSIKCFIAIGVFSTVMVVVAFTRIPYDIQVWLGTSNSRQKFKPDYIIFLGGSGMPSGDNLVRLYYTAHVAEKDTGAKVVIAHPIDESVIQQMKNYLLNKGVDSARILIEKQGTSTREQALKIKEHFSGMMNKNVVLVTSPEYMYRSVASFRKVGFSSIGGVAAFENAMFVNLEYDHDKVGGKDYLPDVSGNVALRYNFWNYLKLEITCMREFLAIAYYKMNRWI